MTRARRYVTGSRDGDRKLWHTLNRANSQSRRKDRPRIVAHSLFSHTLPADGEANGTTRNLILEL